MYCFTIRQKLLSNLEGQNICLCIKSVANSRYNYIKRYKFKLEIKARRMFARRNQSAKIILENTVQRNMPKVDEGHL